MKKFFLVLSLVLMSHGVSAQVADTSRPSLTYDVSAAAGSTNGNSYNEIKLGLNYFVTDYFNWRNALFTRFGDNLKSASGLESNILGTYTTHTSGRGVAFELFGGPGVRIASENNNAATAQAGVIVTLGGLRIGGGAQYLNYFNNRDDKDGVRLPRNETQYFVIVAGGGSF